MTIRSRVTGAHVVEIASRIAFWVSSGVFPTAFVLHSCDNPPCCNPKHLRLGTQKDNIDDAVARGRLKIPAGHAGETNTNARLNDEKVRTIRAAPKNVSNDELAAVVGVSKHTVRAVRLGLRWKHVT